MASKKIPLVSNNSFMEKITGKAYTRRKTIDDIQDLIEKGKYSDVEIDSFLDWSFDTGCEINEAVDFYEYIINELESYNEKEGQYREKSWKVMDCIADICVLKKCSALEAYNFFIGNFGFSRIEDAKRIIELAEKTETKLDDTIELYKKYGLRHLAKYFEPIASRKKLDLIFAKHRFTDLLEELENSKNAEFIEKYGLSKEEFAISTFKARISISKAKDLYEILANEYQYKNEELSKIWSVMCNIVGMIPSANLTDIILIYTSCIRINPNYKIFAELSDMTKFLDRLKKENNIKLKDSTEVGLEQYLDDMFLADGAKERDEFIFIKELGMIRQRVGEGLNINSEVVKEYIQKSGKDLNRLTPLDYYVMAVGSINEETQDTTNGIGMKPRILFDFYKYLNLNKEGFNAETNIYGLLSKFNTLKVEKRKAEAQAKQESKLRRQAYIEEQNKKNSRIVGIGNIPIQRSPYLDHFINTNRFNKSAPKVDNDQVDNRETGDEPGD